MPPAYEVMDTATVLTFHIRLQEMVTVVANHPPTEAKRPQEVVPQFLAVTFRGTGSDGLVLSTVVATGSPRRPARSVETWVVRFEAHPEEWDEPLSAMPPWMVEVLKDLIQPMSLRMDIRV